ncbi:sensor histidine kinase [Pedobacter metabolipauper]|uniref:Histidine kinase n=1 Tax=Pedobacter metabolipauper TaxID=425513 RepID=A0A4R6T0B5_9SPHI|nr:histidine kinase [Pedobacter metabolipauper]TDQ11842.1 histidine kinase [Pedobacter metabolipauper]
MKKKTGILIVVFVLFYAMIHLGRYLPDLYTGKFSLVDERGYDERLLSLAADLLMSFLFTFSAYLMLHRYYPTRKYVILAIGLVSVFIICFIVSYIAAQWFTPQHIRLSGFFRENVLYNGFYTIFAMVFYFVRYTQFKELQQRELALQNRDSELSFLRSQINPHFLFNNLNNIYSMVYHNSDQSLSAISGLSELLRYMLYDTSETITLEKEVHYIEKYIALEQLRFEKPGKLNFTWSGDAHQINLPPLLLIPFIENAFKHGDIDFERTWLDISISTTPNHEILLCCINDVGTKRKDQTGGIGIENVRKRLNLLYPQNHNLNIEQQPGKFKVELKLGKYSSPIQKKHL